MFFKIIAGLIIIIALLLLVLRLSGKQHQAYNGAANSLSDWMSRLPDDIALNKVIVPGSHDAGTVGTIWCAETQSYTIEQQLLCGVRYFDLRVHKKSENEYVMFHSIADGMDFRPVLKWIKDFIKANPSEVLFLDFQHFKGESQEGVFKLLTEELYREGLMLENTTGQDDIDFLRNITLGKARGKCLAFFGDESPLPSGYIFSRNTDRCTMQYAALDSYYISPMHKKDANYLIEQGHPQYLGRMEMLKEQKKNAFFVLQCQQTDGLVVRGPWARDRGNHNFMTNYINALKDSKYLDDLNIIMRDFITPEKCADIINLNCFKDSLKQPVLPRD